MTPCIPAIILCLTSGETQTAYLVHATEEASTGLALAAAVALWANRNLDADAMTVAAELARAHEGRAPSGTDGGVEIVAESLFDRAAALADQVDVAERVQQRRSVDSRGIARGLGSVGPIGRLILIEPQRPLTFSMTARGSEQALLHVGPTGGGDLEVSVVDDRGRTVCEGRAPGAPLLCGWRPAFATNYSVRIRVRSAAPVTTVITSN
jgi:hypothetical protein